VQARFGWQPAAQITRRSPRTGARQCSSTAAAPSDSLIVVSGDDVGVFSNTNRQLAWRASHRSRLQQQGGESRCRYLTSLIGTETKNPSALCAAQRCGSHEFNATRWITINARFTAQCARTSSSRSSNADRRRLRASAVVPQDRWLSAGSALADGGTTLKVMRFSRGLSRHRGGMPCGSTPPPAFRSALPPCR
jgi:hypothetical protein